MLATCTVSMGNSSKCTKSCDFRGRRWQCNRIRIKCKFFSRWTGNEVRPGEVIVDIISCLCFLGLNLGIECHLELKTKETSGCLQLFSDVEIEISKLNCVESYYIYNNHYNH